MVTADTVLAGCVLEVERVPARAALPRLRCRPASSAQSVTFACAELRRRSTSTSSPARSSWSPRSTSRRSDDGPVPPPRRRHPARPRHSHDHDHPHDHGDHSGYETGAERVEVLERIFDENDRTAARTAPTSPRAGVCAVNLMSSPGAGKTTLLRETLRRLRRPAADRRHRGRHRDQPRRRPAGRARRAWSSWSTPGNGFGGECHLDAPMVRSRAARGCRSTDLDLVLVENVGNLVCPAEFDVGEHARAMIYSVTEGEDKPLKYPVMFRSADVVLVNKIDLLPHLDFDLDLFRAQPARGQPARAGPRGERAHRRRPRRVLCLGARPARGGPRWRVTTEVISGVVRARSGRAPDAAGCPARPPSRRAVLGRRPRRG